MQGSDSAPPISRVTCFPTEPAGTPKTYFRYARNGFFFSHSVVKPEKAAEILIILKCT